MSIDWKWVLIGYVLGSFFGITQLLGLAGNVNTGVAKSA